MFDITVRPNTLTAVYTVGVPPLGTSAAAYGWETAPNAKISVTGEAMFYNRTASAIIRHPEREVQFIFVANLKCDPDDLPYWKIWEKLDPWDEEIDLGAEIGDTGNMTVSIDQIVNKCETDNYSVDLLINETCREGIGEKKISRMRTEGAAVTLTQT